MTNITIIIPVYNQIKYIKKCLNALIKQSMDGIEIILVDDGSTDGSQKICDDYSKKYSFIKTIHQPNLGVAAARNIGIKNASGKWISWIDSDDLVSSNYVKFLKSFSRSDFDIVIFGYRIFSDSLPSVGNVEKKSIKEISKNEVMKNLSNVNFGNFLWNKLFKKELFTNISFPNGKVYEDIATTFRLLDKAAKIGISSEKIYFYRQNNESIVHQHNSDKAIVLLEDRIDAQSKLISYLNSQYPLAAELQKHEMLIAMFEYIKEIEISNSDKNGIYEYCQEYIKSYDASIKKDGIKICGKVFLFNNFYGLYKLILNVHKG